MYEHIYMVCIYMFSHLLMRACVSRLTKPWQRDYQ